MIHDRPTQIVDQEQIMLCFA